MIRCTVQHIESITTYNSLLILKDLQTRYLLAFNKYVSLKADRIAGRATR